MGINQKKNTRKILIITSCIYPNKVCTDFESKIGSVEERVNRYIYTIKKIKIKNFDKTYFIDNSKYEIKDFPALLNILKFKNIEVINFKLSANSFKKGKGYQECEMINYILSQQNSETYFFKLTGTIPILNFSNLLKKFERLDKINYSYFLSSKISNTNKIIDTRFFYTHKKTWESFTKNYQNYIDDKNNIYLENVLFFFCKLNNIKYKLFYPDIGNKFYLDGNGKRYKTSRFKFIIKKLIYQICF